MAKLRPESFQMTSPAREMAKKATAGMRKRATDRKAQLANRLRPQANQGLEEQLEQIHTKLKN